MPAFYHQITALHRGIVLGVPLQLFISYEAILKIPLRRRFAVHAEFIMPHQLVAIVLNDICRIFGHSLAVCCAIISRPARYKCRRHHAKVYDYYHHLHRFCFFLLPLCKYNVLSDNG
jgi:hypothetical protein